MSPPPEPPARHGPSDSHASAASVPSAHRGVDARALSADAARSQATTMLALAEEAEPNLIGADQAQWLTRLEETHDALRAALAWAVAQREAALGLRLAGALWRFWYIRGHFGEGRRWLGDVLALPGASEATAERAAALNGAGNLAYSQADHLAAQAIHEEALAIRRQLGDQRGIAATLNNLALVRRALGHAESARQLYEEALALNRTLRTRAWEAINLDNLANLAYDRGAYAEAQRLLEASEAIFEELADAWGMGMVRGDMGTVALARQRYPSARTHFRVSSALRRQVGDRRGIALAQLGLAQVYAAVGERAAAWRAWSESMQLLTCLGNPQDLAEALELLAQFSVERGDSPGAARLAGAATAMRGRVGTLGPRARREPLERALRTARERLSEVEYRRHWVEGFAMPRDLAVAEALAAADRQPT